MTEKEIEEIEARANAATPGPWMMDSGMKCLEDGDSHFQHVLAAGMDNPACGQGIADTYHSPSITVPWDGEVQTIPPTHGKIEDARFIAHAREDVPKLIAESRRLSFLLSHLSCSDVQVNGIVRSCSTREEIDSLMLEERK